LIKGDERQDDFGVYIRGIERVLLEHHIQYSFIPDAELSAQRLKGIKALLLPNVAYISDHDLDIIRQYVKDGGGLIASKNTSLFDEKGNQRKDFGLADIFGVSWTGVTLDTANDTYQLIRDRNSPILKNVGDTDILINGGTTLLVKAVNKNYQIAATHIPTTPNQPPEYAWIPEMKTSYPTIISGVFGKGRVVYFANSIEALAFTNGHEDYSEIYKNALDYAAGGDDLVKVNAPRSVHVNVMVDQHDGNHLIAALVNTTGTSQRPMKEVVSVPAEVRIPLRGRSLKSSKVLWGEGVKVSVEKDAVSITAPALGEFASIEISL
jgi:hypothetical protein